MTDETVEERDRSTNGAAKASLDAVFPRVYDQLRSIAEAYLRRERGDHTLVPTALVHEAYMRLSSQRTLDVEDRLRFFGLAAEMMRRILVNHAHARLAEKRGGDAVRITLDDGIASDEESGVDLVALDEALKRLAAFDLRASRIVELRFFAGLNVDETAAVMEISPATVKREWSSARAWLRREIAAA